MKNRREIIFFLSNFLVVMLAVLSLLYPQNSAGVVETPENDNKSVLKFVTQQIKGATDLVKNGGRAVTNFFKEKILDTDPIKEKEEKTTNFFKRGSDTFSDVFSKNKDKNEDQPLPPRQPAVGEPITLITKEKSKKGILRFITNSFQSLKDYFKSSGKLVTNSLRSSGGSTASPPKTKIKSGEAASPKEQYIKYKSITGKQDGPLSNFLKNSGKTISGIFKNQEDIVSDSVSRRKESIVDFFNPQINLQETESFPPHEDFPATTPIEEMREVSPDKKQDPQEVIQREVPSQLPEIIEPNVVSTLPTPDLPVAIDEGFTKPVIQSPASPDSEVKFGIYDIKIDKNGYTPRSIVVRQEDVIQLRLTAIDGEYDFHIPFLGLYQSVSQGETRQVGFGATLTGTFTFKCRDHCPAGETINGEIIISP